MQSELSELEKVKRALTEFLEANALARESIEDAQLIAEEVLVNILQHGYAGEDSHTIEMQFALTPEHLQMTFEDRGKPFNPLTEIATSDADWDDAQRASGGFGFHLVRELSEHLEYRRQDDKNILVVFQSFAKRSKEQP